MYMKMEEEGKGKAPSNVLVSYPFGIHEPGDEQHGDGSTGLMALLLFHVSTMTSMRLPKKAPRRK